MCKSDMNDSSCAYVMIILKTAVPTSLTFTALPLSLPCVRRKRSSAVTDCSRSERGARADDIDDAGPGEAFEEDGLARIDPDDAASALSAECEELIVFHNSTETARKKARQ